MNLNTASVFIKNFVSLTEQKGIDVSDLELDHIGYQASSNEDYDLLLPEFQKFAELLTEEIVNGRRVGIFRLQNPLYYTHYQIPAIELIAPKEGQVCPSDWEHGEFVLNESFESFMRRYPEIAWDTAAMHQPNFPIIRLKIAEHVQVKFHLEAVLDIVDKLKRKGD